MTTIAASHVVTPTGVRSPGVVEMNGDRVVSIAATTGPVPDQVVVPGLVDLQVNGHDDVDVATAGGNDWDRLDQLLAAQGVTSWCPTLVSGPLDGYDGPLARIAEAAARPGPRPFIAGVHLEGPFLGARPGAHRQEMIIDVDQAWIEDLPDLVRLVTVAPEAVGVLDAIGSLTERGVVVGLGHTAASMEAATAAIDAGARLVTHVFNAMPGLDHRSPGVVGAALVDDRVWVSIIADLVHVHPATIEVAFRCKPAGAVVLVTDAVAWRSGALESVRLRHLDGAPRLRDGTLAGSSLTLDAAVGNVVRRCGVGLADAVAAASTTPAELLGLTDRGRIAPGARADLAVLGPDLRCRQTWIGGVQVFG